MTTQRGLSTLLEGRFKMLSNSTDLSFRRACGLEDCAQSVEGIALYHEVVHSSVSSGHKRRSYALKCSGYVVLPKESNIEIVCPTASETSIVLSP